MGMARDETLCRESRSVTLSSSDTCILVLGNSLFLCVTTSLSLKINVCVIHDRLILLICKDLLQINNKKSNHQIQRRIAYEQAFLGEENTNDKQTFEKTINLNDQVSANQNNKKGYFLVVFLCFDFCFFFLLLLICL